MNPSTALVKATIVGSTQNLNPTSATAVVWTDLKMVNPDKTLQETNSPDVDITKIYVRKTGLVRIYTNLAFSSSNARVNPRVRVRKNGSEYCIGHGLGGYVRAASGHNEGSTSIMTQDYYQKGDYFEVMVDRVAAAGTCTPIDNGSILLIDYKS